MQPGFAWLDKKTLEIEHERNELDATYALELFLDVLDGDANSFEDFRRLKAHVQELEQRKASASVHGRGDRVNNVSSMIGVFKRSRLERYVKETMEEFVPRLKMARRAFPDLTVGWCARSVAHLPTASAGSGR